MPILRFWFWLAPWVAVWAEFLGILAVSAVTRYFTGIDATFEKGFARWLPIEIMFMYCVITWFVIEFLLSILHAIFIKAEVPFMLDCLVEAAFWLILWWMFGFDYWTGFVFGFMLGPYFQLNLKPNAIEF